MWVLFVYYSSSLEKLSNIYILNLICDYSNFKTFITKINTKLSYFDLQLKAAQYDFFYIFIKDIL